MLELGYCIYVCNCLWCSIKNYVYIILLRSMYVIVLFICIYFLIDNCFENL